MLLASPISLLNNARELREGLFADAAISAEAADVVGLSFDNPLGHGRLDFIEFSPDFLIALAAELEAAVGWSRRQIDLIDRLSVRSGGDPLA